MVEIEQVARFLESNGEGVRQEVADILLGFSDVDQGAHVSPQPLHSGLKELERRRRFLDEDRHDVIRLIPEDLPDKDGS